MCITTSCSINQTTTRRSNAYRRVGSDLYPSSPPAGVGGGGAPGGGGLPTPLRGVVDRVVEFDRRVMTPMFGGGNNGAADASGAQSQQQQPPPSQQPQPPPQQQQRQQQNGSFSLI